MLRSAASKAVWVARGMPRPNPAVTATLPPRPPDVVKYLECCVKARRAQEAAILLDANVREILASRVRGGGAGGAVITTDPASARSQEDGSTELVVEWAELVWEPIED